MKLTPLQLEIQKLGADKSQSFGCLIGYKYTFYINILDLSNKTLKHLTNIKIFVDFKGTIGEINYKDGLYEILGHPIRYDRLCYLRFQKVLSDEQEKLWLQIEYSFIDDVCLYNQSILEWNEQTQLLVRDFLLSIQ